jgi:hypothetical protein
MRPSIRASTGLRAALFASFFAAACAHRSAGPRPSSPPPRVIVVTEGRVSLRASAYGELAAWLAIAARTEAPVPEELGPAVAATRRSLDRDDDDQLFRSAFAALAACSDDRCAAEAAAPHGFGHAYARSIVPFVGQSWERRASTAFAGIEIAHSVLAMPGTEVLFSRVASEIGVTWPDRPVVVDIVADAPPPGPAGLLPPALASHGLCFARERARLREPDRIGDARLLDCILVQAILALPAPPPLASALIEKLGPRAGERAFVLVVIHAVAATVKGWELRHTSVYRRAAGTVEGRALAWLAKEWHGVSEPEAFASRLASAWAGLHDRADTDGAVSEPAR